MGEVTPSENEWLIMEVIWKENKSITASEIIEKLKGILDVSQKTIRVMIGRLVAKGVLNYTVDENDSRIYHYFPLKTKEECLNLKSRRFVKNYFGGDTSLAVASFLKSTDITKEQFAELEELVESLRERQ